MIHATPAGGLRREAAGDGLGEPHTEVRIRGRSSESPTGRLRPVLFRPDSESLPIAGCGLALRDEGWKKWAGAAAAVAGFGSDSYRAEPTCTWGRVASQGETGQGREDLDCCPAVLLSLPTVRHLTRCEEEEARAQGREGVGDGGEAT
jgi:hypothetical protein